MKVVVQRVKKGRVMVGGELVSDIGVGYFVLVGIAVGDDLEKAERMADKLVKLRVMPSIRQGYGGGGRMDLSVKDVNGEMLVVSQFTLYADTRGGNRPSFLKAARPDEARTVFEGFVDRLKSKGVGVKTGRFGADMEINVVLDGPVTILMEG